MGNSIATEEEELIQKIQQKSLAEIDKLRKIKEFKRNTELEKRKNRVKKELVKAVGAFLEYKEILRKGKKIELYDLDDMDYKELLEIFEKQYEYLESIM